ncbi:cytochrome P450 [Nakamurella sp. YIM 132087]|uniref:Cytochrome P450 n=1 Tax=Nakamurella alba TaxID=2665158 RepID=A0A7K1FJD3_9ACTN|nr:cytochrome P450 [Nakamurella alba]
MSAADLDPVALDPAAAGFDPADPRFLADPYPVFGRLRALGPVLPFGPRGVYLLPRYAEVNAALRDRRLGRDFKHLYTEEEFGQPAPDDRWPRWQLSERWSLLNLEPPDHTRLRRLITKVFTARSVAALRPRIADIAARRLDEAVGNSGAAAGFDLIGDYAQPFSVAVICTLLGVPLPDGPKLLEWSHAIVKMYEFSTSDDERGRAEIAADEFIDRVRALIAERRTDPREDLITELVQVSDSGDRLTENEIVSTVIVLLNAGHEATVNTLGNGMRAMMLHPAQWARVTSGEVGTAAAVEELIRWDAPLQLFERWVLHDGVELGGVEFRRGDRVAMMFGSANRDPDRFPDPDAFDAGRGDATHIGFGGGLHFCIGAPLARLELEVSLDLLRRYPDLHLTETPVYQPYFVIRGLSALRLQP